MAKRRNGEGSWGIKMINGITYKRYRSPEGKDFYGKTEKEAKLKYQKWQEEHKELPTEQKTLDDVALEWLQSKKKKVKNTTYDGYEYFVNQVLKYDHGYTINTMQIHTITPDHIQNYIDNWADWLPMSSIHKNKSLLNQIFNYAKRKKYITESPVTDEIKLPIEEQVTKQTKKHIFLTTDDRHKLEQLAFQKMKYREGDWYGNNAKVIVFLLHTGLRFGEVTGLRWKNVDLENKNIFIIDNSPIIKNRSKTGPVYTLDKTTPKRKSSQRHVSLSDMACKILMYFYERYPHEDDDLVFVSKTGTPLNRRNVNRTLIILLNAADCSVKEASVHDLRHSFGSELILHGVDIKVVSELMGHKDIQTTYNIYIHILPEQKSNAIQIFNTQKEAEN